jgi:cyclic pyranopterin monophosphate synthase
MLTHIDQKNNPTMVDVTDKVSSIRMAEAQTQVLLPIEMEKYFVGEELVLKKGPVFQTAIIAGTMAVKRTHEIIPFCHQIPVESCKFEISVSNLLVTIKCRVKTTFKTGVEMEALHGAMTAALTIYDMAKAVSHNIVILETKLSAKTGGKKTFLGRPTYGLVLTGGKSQRMGEDKALLEYYGKPHALYIHDILQKYCDDVYLSAKKDQWANTKLSDLKTVTDQYEGPIGGMLSAFATHPDANWIIAACDLVYFNNKTIEKLLANASDKIATCYKNTEKGFPEPLCTFYTPEAREVFLDAYHSQVSCPVKVLRQTSVELIDQEEGINLANINTPEERHAIN